MLIIRKFRKGDERKLSYLCRKCTTQINSKDLTKKQTSILINHFTSGLFVREAKHGAYIFVAIYNGKMAGTATLDHGIVRLVFVSPSLHGKRIGTKLMNKVETTAKKLGVPFLQLKSSKFAEKFYKKLGYKKVKYVENEAGKMMLMKKKCSRQ